MWYRLFQRPDDAIHRGFDKQTEKDLSREEILSVILNASIKKMQKNKYQKHLLLKSIPTDAKLIKSSADKNGKESQFVSSANPRIVDGKPTKNPRYLQTRPDLPI